MLKKIFKLITGTRSKEILFFKLVEKINSYAYTQLSDSELDNEISEYKIKHFDFRASPKKSRMHLKGEQQMLCHCYALTKEICRRKLGLIPFDSQLVCGIALHYNYIVELPTGEGKTLAAVFPIVFNSLLGDGVHVFTFNDYLAKRDACWMKPIYDQWGLSTCYIQEEMTKDERKRAYLGDITYVTPKEAGFDYLRDGIVYNVKDLVHRPFNFALVDEADSILIDEARIPLVIAGNVNSIDNTRNLIQLLSIVNNFHFGIHYNTDENKRNAFPTDVGIALVEKQLNCGNLFTTKNIEILTALNNIVHARALLKKDIDYIVKNNKIELIDELTGRVAENRRWPDGIHDAVELIEGIYSDQKGQILGSITLQNYLSLYPRLAGMTATAKSSSDELHENYHKSVFVVEPHKKCIRKDMPDAVFTHKQAKYLEVVNEIVKANNIGRPVLVGTSSVEESEMLANYIQNIGLLCNVLNARNDEQEAAIIANAGRIGAITISTNMAGRGVDIQLGGGHPQEAKKVAELGGLYVIGINKNECERIDRQLRGRAGRQGDPGETRFFVSFHDDLLVKFGMNNILPPQYRGILYDHEIHDNRLVSQINHIQRVVNGQNGDIRHTVSKYGYTLEHQRRIIQEKRHKMLNGDFTSLILQNNPDQYNELCQTYGNEVIIDAERMVTLSIIDRRWFDFLDYCEYIKEGIHLVSVTRKSPLDEYRKAVIDAFDNMIKEMQVDIIQQLETIDFLNYRENLENSGLLAPSATWTYMISDNFKHNKFSWLTGWN